MQVAGPGFLRNLGRQVHLLLGDGAVRGLYIGDDAQDLEPLLAEFLVEGPQAGAAEGGPDVHHGHRMPLKDRLGHLVSRKIGGGKLPQNGGGLRGLFLLGGGGGGRHHLLRPPPLRGRRAARESSRHPASRAA